MFVVISASSIPNHVRGYLTRFLTQVDTNLFVGKTSRRVAELLWERTSSAIGEGSATMVISDKSTEQGFRLSTIGNPQRTVMDIDGIMVAMRPESVKKEGTLS